MPEQLTFLAPPTGDELRDKGMQQAVDHANVVIPKWADMAFLAFKRYVETVPVGTEAFLTEDVRAYAAKLGVPEPPDKRAWGHVTRRIKDAGLIKPAGFLKATDPLVHSSINPAWRRA